MELNLTDVLTLVFSLSALIIAIVVAARQGKNIDEVTAERLAKMADRETMDKYERAFQQASDEKKLLIGMLGRALDFFAPLTPFKSDDAAAKFVEDIQVPGPAPESAPGTA